MQITHSISLDFQRHKTPSQIDVVQDDTYSRYVAITLYDNVAEWPVPDGVTIAVRFKKPDKTQGVYDTLPNGEVAYSVNGNVVTVGIAPQMLVAKGKVTASVVIYLGSVQLATFPFVLNVVENPAAGQSISNDYYYLQTWDDVNAAIGSLADLETEDKSSLVAAINEVAKNIGNSDTTGSILVDATLTKKGQAADAKAVGDALKEIQVSGESAKDVTEAYTASGLSNETDYLLTLTEPGEYLIQRNAENYRFRCQVENVNGALYHWIRTYGDDSIYGELLYIDGALVSDKEIDYTGAFYDVDVIDGVRYPRLGTSPQTLTEAQRENARNNIGAIPTPASAAVGQTIVVKEVDEEGKPIAWTAADLPDSAQNVASIFTGKTASFYGDSLTEVNWHYTKGYHKWVSEILGLTSYNNYGVSGYKVADVLNKVNSVTDTSDIIFVMVGVNDVQFNVPLGTLSELKSGTVYGNLDALCAKLREKYPTKLLVFITPAEQTKYPGTIGVSMHDIQKATKEVCERYSIVVYDCFTYGEICTTNLSYWTTDNCHWNDKAHEMVGKNLAHFVMNTFRYIPESSGQSTKTLNSITATFNQGDTIIYDTDKLDSLKQYLTVTANYSDGSTATVTGYTLSGTLAEGTSTITASYSGKSATFTVEVTKNSESGGGDTKVDNSEYIGKTLKMNGYKNGNFNFTAIVEVDADFATGNTVELNLTGSNAVNMASKSNGGAQLFGDNSGKCGNSLFDGTFSTGKQIASTVDSNGNVTVDLDYVFESTPTTKYLKVIAFLGAVNTNNPSSFTIEQISVTVNGKEKEILAIGGFFVDEPSELLDAGDSGDDPGTEPETSEWPLQIINNSFSSAIYKDNTLTLTGLNQTFGGVIFDGAKEVTINAEENDFGTTGGLGWLLARDGNKFHGIGLNNSKSTEQYDFTSNLSSASQVGITSVQWPTTGTVVMKIEGDSVNLYFNDTLAHSLPGDAIGYAASPSKPHTLYGMTIA